MKTLIYPGLILVLAAIGCGGGPTPVDSGDIGPADSLTQTDTPPDDGIPGDVISDASRDVHDEIELDAPADLQGDTPDDAGDIPDEAADVPDADLPDADVPDADLPDADVPDDADIPDATTCIPAWALTAVPIYSAELADPALPRVGRTLRIRVVAVLKCNQRRAMPEVTIDHVARTIRIRPGVWDAASVHCAGPDYLDGRIIAFAPTSAGVWHVQSSDGSDLFTIEVSPGTAMDCVQVVYGCDLDCDCAEGVCLRGYGLVGPFTQCATPCEENADCPGGASCISVDDGLDHFCDAGTPECTGESGCPAGFKCESNACVPTYALNQTSRHECDCDADCDAPLTCVEPADPTGTRRCEFMCPTAGYWCPGAHVCGPAGNDISGLAATDSVCGWQGE